MTLNYNRVWAAMNELESVTAKICSAREILACAIDAHESGNANRTETLLYAVDEYLQYYLSEFDKKFQEAWSETVTKLHQEKNDAFDAVMKEREYYEPTQVQDKVIKWQLPVEQVHEEYFITFPDDLLEAANLKVGDDVEWVDRDDGSFLLQKVTKTEQN
jgi:hypothetical protein